MNTHYLAQAAALGTMGFSLVVAHVDRPHQLAAAGSTDCPAAIEAGADHITPSELAGLLLVDARSGLLVDMRSFAEFTATPQDPPATKKSEPAKAQAPAFARLATDPAALTKPTIVSAAWVSKRGTALVLLDARDKPEDFAAGHIPGARHVPIQSLREAHEGVPDQLLTPDKLAAVFGRLGIDAETEVVAYGEAKLQDPSHLALALISVGHQKVAILEGGLPAWKVDGRALSVEAAPVVTKTYVPRPAPGFRAAALEDVKNASTGSTTRILDVRPTDAFRGDVSTEARAGHIPGSLNRPYTADIASTEAGPFWRPVVDLRREYEAMGLKRAEPVIVSCRTGHQAAQSWFTLRYVLGYENVLWYDGSWKEWAARPELPVATGPVGK